MNNFHLNGLNQFYDDYRAVVSNLKSPTGQRIQQDLGDSYDPWMAYLKTVTPMPTPEELPTVFFNWAVVNAPDVAAPCRNDYEALLNDPVGLAQTSVGNQAGFINNTPNFSRTIADLRSALTHTSNVTFDDKGSMNAEISSPPGNPVARGANVSTSSALLTTT